MKDQVGSRTWLRNRLSARERLVVLLDSGSFVEIGGQSLAGKECWDDSAVVTGFGDVCGRRIYVFAQDFNVKGGSISRTTGEKICQVMDLACKNGSPLVALLESGGARIQEGSDSLAACGQIFTRNARYSGVIPQISAVMGPCAGSAVYSTAITDFVFMVRRTGRMFITGPEVVKTVTGERVTSEELGSVDIHAAISGSCHFVAESDIECLNAIRRLLSFLPSSNRDEPPQGVGTIEPGLPDEELATIVPADPGCGYDIRHVIARLVDNADYFEIQSAFAPNLVTAFARMGGKVVGIVAQQPSYMAGVIDCNASDKGARFVRFCDAFNISIVTLVDTPGYMPGKKEEQKGIIRHGAKLLYAYAEATVPKVSVVLRKAYGGAYIVMSSKGLGGDINYAWPSAEIAVMGPESAVNILYKKELNIADNQPQYRRQLIDEFRRQISDPGAAKSKGHLDEVILPGDTRRKLISALKSLESRQAVQLVRKHGNIPL